MAAADFFTEIFKPTIDEFDRHPGDVRRGVLACLVLQAMNEHFYKERKAVPQDVYDCTNLDEFKVKL